MNKRIEELARDCWSTSEYDTSLDPWFNHRKFAELIVRECADYIDAFNRENMVEEGMDGAYMKKHFGVEE